MIFKGLSVAKNFLRPDSAPLKEYPLNERRCKTDLGDKQTYSKSQCRTTYHFTRNEPSLYP